MGCAVALLLWNLAQSLDHTVENSEGLEVNLLLVCPTLRTGGISQSVALTLQQHAVLMACSWWSRRASPVVTAALHTFSRPVRGSAIQILLAIAVAGIVCNIHLYTCNIHLYTCNIQSCWYYLVRACSPAKVGELFQTLRKKAIWPWGFPSNEAFCTKAEQNNIAPTLLASPLHNIHTDRVFDSAAMLTKIHYLCSSRI